MRGVIPPHPYLSMAWCLINTFRLLTHSRNDLGISEEEEEVEEEEEEEEEEEKVDDHDDDDEQCREGRDEGELQEEGDIEERE
jgi:hypothetical protein